MKKLLLLTFLFATFQLSAQEVIEAEAQGTTSNIILTIVTGGQAFDYSVDNFKVTYTTVDAFGQPDTATGLVCIPAIEDIVFPIAVYNHGTVDSRDQVPSVVGVQERFVPQAIAASGFIALAPDYLGLGDSDGIHPYFHAATEASAGRDMIIAVRAWLDEQSIPANEQLFVTGYSQGGHASMALHRMLEGSADNPTITAAAHLSGSFIVQPPSPQLLAITEPNPITLRFFLNQVIAYEDIYQLYGGVTAFFKEPYQEQVNLFVADEIDLARLGIVIDSLIRDNNAILGSIFIDEYLTDIQSMDPELFAAYGENTVLDWAPEKPTLIYACPGDEIVDPANAQIAFDTMTVLGSTSVELTFGPENTHGGCVIPSVLAAVTFFQQFANVYPVSLGEPNAHSEVRLSPNPVAAGTELTVAGVAGNRPYVIYDLSGRQLVNGVTSVGGGINLPASLPRGTSVVRIGLADGTSVVRRIVVR